MPRTAKWLDHTARVGVVVYGIVHLIVAWLVLRLALGVPRTLPRGTRRPIVHDHPPRDRDHLHRRRHPRRGLG